MTKRKYDLAEYCTAYEAASLLTLSHGRRISPGYVHRVRGIRCVKINPTTKLYLREDVENARVRRRCKASREDYTMNIDEFRWEGEITASNVEHVREALGKRMKTRHIAVDKHTLFTKDDLKEEDYVIFTPQQVTLRLVYGQGKWRTHKTVTF